MKMRVSLEADIIVEFDETSEEFKNLFEEYKASIDSSADYESFAENIASLAARYGTDEFVEGVGYPRINGRKQKTYGKEVVEHDCPVNMICEDMDINGKIEFLLYTQTIDAE